MYTCGPGSGSCGLTACPLLDPHCLHGHSTSYMVYGCQAGALSGDETCLSLNAPMRRLACRALQLWPSRPVALKIWAPTWSVPAMGSCASLVTCRQTPLFIEPGKACTLQVANNTAAILVFRTSLDSSSSDAGPLLLASTSTTAAAMTLGDLAVSSDSVYLAATYSGSATIASTAVGTTDSGATQAYAAGLIMALNTHTNVSRRQLFLEGSAPGLCGCAWQAARTSCISCGSACLHLHAAAAPEWSALSVSCQSQRGEAAHAGLLQRNA